MSAVSRLVSSPVRRSAKKPGGISSSRANSSAPEPGHRPLADGAQQVGLGVVEHRLDAEEHHQAERDAVEQRPVVLHERGVEQVAHDHREGEAEQRAGHQGQRWRAPASRDTAAPGARGGPAARAAGTGAAASGFSWLVGCGQPWASGRQRAWPAAPGDRG